jgi:prepilin-type N-terminal cleavage/methylation domain-containing protein
MRSNRGFTLMELLVVVGLIAVLSAVSIPYMLGSTARNSVWTASEQIGSQIRQARLKAISHNLSFQVRFDCPEVGQFRVLRLTGVSTTDDGENRCHETLDYDSGVFAMPVNVDYGEFDEPLKLTVNSRGVFSSTAGIPTTITVTYSLGETSSRALTMSATGQISFAAY